MDFNELGGSPEMMPATMPPSLLMPPTDGNTAMPNFNIIMPKPFSLAAQSESDKKKLRDEVMDKVKTWENRMNQFFNDYQSYADSWRVKPTRSRVRKPTGLFNSKSGETHRAGETMGTFWLRGMTANDPYFEAIPEGLDDFGNEITPEQCYASERVILKQLRVSHYKEKLMRSLRSVAIFGTAIFEEPWVKIPYRNGMSYFEYTDFVFRSLLKTPFDTDVWDVNLSDFMATIDFPNKYLLKRWVKTQGEYWDDGKVNQVLTQYGKMGENKSGMNNSTGAWNRVNESKTRAGYTEIDNNVFELINFHGKVDTENSVIAAYWESEGRQDDPADFDFTCGVLSGEDLVRFHETQFGTWHSRFKVAHFKTFEDEPLAYGAARIGKRIQREIDLTLSRTNDTLMKGVYSMYLVGRYAGIKANQFGINPNGLIEVDDVNQVKPLPIDISTIAQALAMIAANKDEFRSTVGAYTNLQAQVSKASSASEAVIAQGEAVRGASVHTELIAETFLREHIETMHYNNLEYLEAAVWVAASGEQKPGNYDKNNLPRNIGIEIKPVTDKTFTPERSTNLLKGLELWSSIRQNFPPSVNAIPELAKEWFRAMDMNPRLLSKPMSMQDQLAMAMNQMQKQGQQPPGVGNELAGEQASAQAGDGANQGLPPPSLPHSLATSAGVQGL